MKHTHTALAVLTLLSAIPMHAAIISNGTGGGTFNVGTTWIGGVAPTVNQDWTIVAGDSVTNASTLSVYNSTSTIEGSLAIVGNSLNIGSGGVGYTLNVSGGSLNLDRIFNNGSVLNSAATINLSSGSINYTNRLALQGSNVDTTLKNSFTISGGALNGGTNQFTLYGKDADDRASLNVIGNVGTFNAGSLNLFSSAVGNELSATDVNFTFGSSIGAGALTVLNSTTLTLGGNALNVDFSAITRPATPGNFSTLLIDYSSTLTGAFAAPSPIGLLSGESASLTYDTINKQIILDYSLIPEPSTYAALAGFAILGIAILRRRRG